MYCSDKPAAPALPTVYLTDIHLEMADPETGNPGIYLAWKPDSQGHATYYEIYQGVQRDSLKSALLTVPASKNAGDTPHVVLNLPDTSLPLTVYYAIRAVWVEATGQKRQSDSLAVDSITILPSFSILQPSPGSYLSGRVLKIEVETQSGSGILLRSKLWEKRAGVWSVKQDTCMPLNACFTPIFGNTQQVDSLVLEGLTPGDTISDFLCLQGAESFQGHQTGLNQSLGCSRFHRIGL